MLVNCFKMCADYLYKPCKMNEDEVNKLMPWMIYKNMQQSDWEAIYAYLRTAKPVNDKVVNYKKKSNAVAKNS